MKVKISSILLFLCLVLSLSAFSQTIVYPNSSCSSNNTSPRPAFTNAADVECGYKVNFDGSTSQDKVGNYNLNFEWDWSYNGVIFIKEDTGINKSHEFPACGDYVIALKVIDPDVSSVCESAIIFRTITVTDKIAPWFSDFPYDVNNNQPCASFPILKFNNAYTQEPGFGDNDGKPEQGEKFRFPQVTPDLDVIVNIVSIVNVNLKNLDLNDSEPNAFKPSTSWNFDKKGKRGYVEFLFEFVEIGTNTPYVLENFVVNFNDIDGHVGYSEQNWSQNPTTYTVNNPTELKLDFNELGWILATGPVFSYPGGLSNNVRANLTTTHNNTSTFKFRVGGVAFEDKAYTSERWHNITFTCLANYENPETITTEITVPCDKIPPLKLLKAEDNCLGNVIVTVDEKITNGRCPNAYTLLRTWTATDACGNKNQRSQTIHVEDNEPPTFKIPKNITLNCLADAGNLTITGNITDPKDNCTDISNLVPTYSDSMVSGSCENDAVVTRTWRLEDECGNIITKDQIINIKDDEKPVTPIAPANSTYQCFTDVPAPGDLTATDNCNGNITVTGVDTINNSDPKKIIITRSWTFTDSCNNSSSISQTITLKDFTNPTISCPTQAAINVNADSCTASNVTLEIPTTADNCGVDTVTNDAPAFFPIGTTSVTWTVTDTSGNKATCTQLVTVIDTINPTISCPATVSVNVDVAVCSTDAANVALGTPTFNDNCSGATISNDAPATFPIGTTTVIWTVTDASGNKATCEQLVNIIDNINPTISCPAPVSVNVDVAACSTDAANVALGTPTFNDNCSGATISNNAPATFSIGNTTVIWTVTDASGNKATCEQLVNITDNINPTISCPAPVSVNVDLSACSTDAANVALGTPTFNDNCSGATIANDAPATFSIGSTTVIWTVTDASGNKATCTQLVTVIDTINPTISCQAPVSVNVDVAACSTDATNVTLGTPTFADNCSGATIANNAPANFPIGTTTITWTVTDASGNKATCTQLVTVIDTINPTISCPAPVSVNVDVAACSTDATNVTLGTPTFADNCSGATIANDAPATFLIGNTTVTWTVTDASGNKATCTQLVTVIDNINPTISCPAPLSVKVDVAACSTDATNVTLGTPTFNDNCSGATITNDAPATFSIGTTTVIWTVTDASGNKATCEQLVNITDNINPTISCPAPVSVNVDVAACSTDATNVTLGTPTFADNCSGATIANDAPANFLIGNTTVTWTVTDASGNKATCTQLVTVIDNINPTISCPAPLSVNVDVAACSTDATNVTLGTPTFNDNCSGATITNDAPATFSIGTTTVIWTVTDASGNKATCEQLVNITDNINPTISCPAPVSVNVDLSACSTDAANVALGTPTFTDNCSGATITNDAPANFPIGTTTITWTVTDASGNKANCTQLVTVIDNINPTISCPAPVSVNVDVAACSTDAANVALGTPAFNDNCSGATISNNAPTTFSIGNTTVIWTVTDASGNKATCEQLVNITDNINPTISCPAPVSVNVDVAACSTDAANVALGTPTFNDNCSGATISNDAPATFPIGNTTVIWTVTDASGNKATCEQLVNITDNINPTISCPAPVSINVDVAACSTDATNVTLGTPTFNDNCSGATITNDAPANFPIGTTTVTWTVTDASGNKATCTQLVTVIDNINPTISCPAPVSVNVDVAACSTDATNVTLGTPTFYDNCSGATITNDAPATFSIGTTTVIWTVTDASGNKATCEQLVNITDNINPTFVESLPEDGAFECDNVPEAAVLTAIDACGTAEISFNEERTDGSCSSEYILKRTWVATDLSGLTTTHVQTITVTDTKAPQPTTTFETSIVVSCDNIPAKPVLEFTDNCSSEVIVVYEETNSFDENNPSNYEIVRSWKVSDVCNNEEIFTQTISVTLTDVVKQVSVRACSDDGAINLDDYLQNNLTGGNWILVEGNAIILQNIFDPENVALGNYKFSYIVTNNGCSYTTEVTIEIHDECIVLPCGREDIVISKVVTPNGDTYNDYFTIEGVETCGFNIELQIFNRWGAKIYENFNYKNDWNAYTHKSSVGNADKVPNGTYYYIINLKDSGLKPFARAFFVGTK